MGIAKVTFIPHSKNNHWPLALRHRSLVYVSSFLILAKIVAVSAIALTPNLAELSTITEASIIMLTNNKRTEAGLPPLATSSALSQAAKLKGEDMLKQQYFAHISPSGITPWFWMKKTNYLYQIAGENLAIDFLDAQDVVSAWLASPTHKDNMLHKEYTETGMAVVSGDFQGGTSVIIVHLFGKPLVAAAQETAPKPVPEQKPKQLPAQKPVAVPTVVPVVLPVIPDPAPSPPPVNILALSPAFDQQQVALVTPSSTWQLFSSRSPLAINTQVIRVLPSFSIREDAAAKSFSAAIVYATRTTTSLVLVTVTCLLFLAIIVRIRTQHPALILHASMVVFLAATMLLW
ncbi:MAG: CAP domain-containing protein [bacterium]|nr:CAP domain-containing protein [bacterium]